MKTDNELIAEFMRMPVNDGWVKLNDTDEMVSTNFKYHQSWNDLMPVVEKIEDMENIKEFDISGKTAYLTSYRESLSKGPSTIVNISDTSKIEAVYKTVVEFIKWYKQQN